MDSRKSYTLSHITDLRLLDEADIEAFQREVPALVAELRIHASAYGHESECAEAPRLVISFDPLSPRPPATANTIAAAPQQSGKVRLGALSDLSQLSDEAIPAFVRDVPSLVATMRMLHRECEKDAVSIIEMFPAIGFDPAVGDQVVMPTSSGEVKVGGDVMVAVNSAFEAIATAKAPRP